MDESADLSRVMKNLRKRGYHILMDKVIYKGTNVEVVKGRKYLNETDFLKCAVRMFKVSALPEAYRMANLPKDFFIRKTVLHRHIVQTFDILMYSEAELHPDYDSMIIMEYARNGPLDEYIKKHGALEENLANVWFRQTSLAVSYLHEERVAHRDLKLANLLLTESWNVKLTNFGFAHRLSRPEDPQNVYEATFGHFYSLELANDSIPYMAPLVLSKQLHRPFKADIWALGVILFKMLNMDDPFPVNDTFHLMMDYPDFIRSRFTGAYSDTARYLMEQCLHPDEDARLEMGQVRKHVWMTNYGLGY